VGARLCMHLQSRTSMLAIENSLASTPDMQWRHVSLARGCRNQGTGKNCAKASDGAGGPTCIDRQVGLCCDAAETSSNCLTLFGDFPLEALTAADGSITARCADQGGSGPDNLTPFCCQEMGLPGSSAFSNYTQCPVGQQT